MPLGVCRHCQRHFIVKPALAGTAKYCSKECKDAAARTVSHAGLQVCGREFKPNGHKIFCDKAVGMLSEPGCPEKSGLKSIHRTIRQRFSSVSVTPAEGRRTDRTGAPNAGRSGAKAQTLRGFPHTNFTEEDPGAWNGTGRDGPPAPTVGFTATGAASCALRTGRKSTESRRGSRETATSKMCGSA